MPDPGTHQLGPVAECNPFLVAPSRDHDSVDAWPGGGIEVTTDTPCGVRPDSLGSALSVPSFTRRDPPSSPTRADGFVAALQMRRPECGEFSQVLFTSAGWPRRVLQSVQCLRAVAEGAGEGYDCPEEALLSNLCTSSKGQLQPLLRSWLVAVGI